MLTDALQRLKSLGYTASAEDRLALGFFACKVENTIKSDCNTPEVPPPLYETAICMAAGEFLLWKKASADGLVGFNLEAAEKSIQEGDTRVDFAVEAGKSPEQRLDALISYLVTPRQSFAPFRRIRW